MRWALLSLALLGTAAGAQTKAEQRAAKLTPDQVAAQVQVTGAAALDPVLRLSTEPVAFQRIGGDQFLRANIDKTTGATTFQLYMILEGRQSLRPNRVTYLVGGALQTATAARVDFNVSCYRANCTHIEHAVATLSLDHLKALAQCKPSEAFFPVRVFGDYAEGRDLAIACNEAAGLMLAVEKRAANTKSG